MNDNHLAIDACFYEHIKAQYITEITDSCSSYGSYNKQLVELIYEFVFGIQDGQELQYADEPLKRLLHESYVVQSKIVLECESKKIVDLFWHSDCM